MDLPTKAWLVWAYDPCPEGGWSVVLEYDTKEEAVGAAQAYHAQKVKRHEEMVEYVAKKYEGSSREPWTWACECYAGCIVTPGMVFEIRTPDEGALWKA